MKIYIAHTIINTLPLNLRKMIMNSRDFMSMSVTRNFRLDVIKLDKAFSEYDPLYDNEKCLYKGEAASMQDYLERRYGKEIAKKVKLLI